MPSCRAGIYFFCSLMFYFICVRELTAKGCSVLDKKSKQKNQEKIIPAFTHRATGPGAIFSGQRASAKTFFVIS
jgi:hypothetical protein